VEDSQQVSLTADVFKGLSLYLLSAHSGMSYRRYFEGSATFLSLKNFAAGRDGALYGFVG